MGKNHRLSAKERYAFHVWLHERREKLKSATRAEIFEAAQEQLEFQLTPDIVTGALTALEIEHKVVPRANSLEVGKRLEQQSDRIKALEIETLRLAEELGTNNGHQMLCEQRIDALLTRVMDQEQCIKALLASLGNPELEQ